MNLRIKFRPQARLSSGLPAPVGTGPADAIAMGGCLVRQIARQIAPPDLLDDAIQEGFRILVEIAPQYDVARGVLFSTYAGKFVRFRLLTYVREARACSLRESHPANIDDAIADRRAGPGLAIANRTERARVLVALRRLSHQERTAVFLRYYRDATCREIGARLGLSLSGAHRVLARAHRRLYPLLRDLAA